MADERARPMSDADRAGWKVYWAEQGMPWRTEPEIPTTRQQYLEQRQKVHPNVLNGIYPFRDENGPMALDRADVEWLVAEGVRSQEVGRGHIGEDGTVQHSGLDLRGADLRAANLRELPLARLVGGLAPDLVADFAFEYQHSVQQSAAILLDRADLSGARLEQSILTSAHLHHAGLVGVHLEQAFLLDAHLDGANLSLAHCQGAFLMRAHLDGVLARNVHLEEADLTGATLSDAFLADAHGQGAKLRQAHLERATLQGAILSGCDFSFAHLEGTRLMQANFGASGGTAVNAKGKGKAQPRAVPALDAATLCGCFFSSTTDLTAAQLGDQATGFVHLADAHFDGVNLGVVDWHSATILGDERAARLATKKGAQDQLPVQLAKYQRAIRANRQLAVALRAQGMNEEADHFAYRAQILRSQSLRLQLCGSGKGLPRLRLRDKPRLAIGYGFSVFLDALAGYGYRPGRALWWYLISLAFFTSLYVAVGAVHGPHLTVMESLVLSVTSFHGRGFFPGGIRLDDPMVVIAASEAIWGLLIELTFIATFTQRFLAR